jgi:hypothetical protein
LSTSLAPSCWTRTAMSFAVVDYLNDGAEDAVGASLRQSAGASLVRPAIYQAAERSRCGDRPVARAAGVIEMVRAMGERTQDERGLDLRPRTHRQVGLSRWSDETTRRGPAPGRLAARADVSAGARGQRSQGELRATGPPSPRRTDTTVMTSPNTRISNRDKSPIPLCAPCRRCHSPGGTRSVCVLESPCSTTRSRFGPYRYRIPLADITAAFFLSSDLGLVSSRVHMAELVQRRSRRPAPVLDITGSGVGLLPSSKE